MVGEYLSPSKSGKGDVFVVKSNPMSGQVYFEFETGEDNRISHNMPAEVFQEDLVDAICMLLDHVDIRFRITHYYKKPGTPFFLITTSRAIDVSDRSKMRDFTWKTE